MHKIKINSQEIEFKLRRSQRARRLRLTVNCDASVVVTLPKRANEDIVEKFMREKAFWLLDKIAVFKKRGLVLPFKNDRVEYLRNKFAASKFAEARVAEINKFYNFKFNKIEVKNQKTRWGSCSRKGNLNFNYKLLFLPRHHADYIVAHELCHLREFNHSRKFWSLVAQAVPGYLEIRKELRKGLV